MLFSSQSPTFFGGGPSPPNGSRWTQAITTSLCIALLLLVASCARDTLVAPELEQASQPPHSESPDVSAAVQGGPNRVGDDALSIEDMLSDPLFQAAIGGITEWEIADPLLQAVSALEAGQVGRAGPLLSQATAAADALLDDPSADFDSLLLWSVIERFLEEAELM